VARRSRRDAARERILEAAACLFYEDGIHAVGVDTIIAESGVAKMTLYRHFPSKDDLIAAYLERANERFWSWLEGEMAQAPVTSPSCRGCGFQGAAAEFPEAAHPAHKVALAHKHQVLERFSALGREAKLRSPEGLAEQLLLLMDGAWVAARMFGPKNPAARVAEAAQALIDAHSVLVQFEKPPRRRANRSASRPRRSGPESSS
jgi:AcrR family transcriptional regulator